jgi:predicted transcriptional regulator
LDQSNTKYYVAPLIGDRNQMNDLTGRARIALIAQIAIGWLNNQDHSITADDLPSLLIKIGEGVDALTPPAAVAYVPAVSVEASLASSEHILSMIDGKPYKGLTRHIAAHGLTPSEYRARYGLQANYPDGLAELLRRAPRGREEDRLGTRRPEGERRLTSRSTRSAVSA